MKRSITYLFFAAVFFSALGLCQAQNWDGTGDGVSFEDTNNWDDPAALFPGSTRTIDGAFTVNRDVGVTINRTFIRGGAVVNIASGSHTDGQSGASIFNFLGDTGAGTVNQSGGDYNIGHGLRVGVGSSPDGTYNLTGGLLEIFRASNSKIEPTNPGGRPSLEVGDTTGTGLFEISGGALNTRAGVHIAPTGTFSVVGSAPTSIDIGPQNTGDGSWIQHGTLQVAVDAGGLTPIFVDDFDDVGGVVGEFKTGALIDVSFLGATTHVPGTWTALIIENTDIIDGGLALTGTTDSNWTFDLDNSGNDGILTVTYVPEPAGLVMITLAIPALLLRRRRS